MLSRQSAIRVQLSMVRTPLVVALGDDLFAVERPWGDLPAGLQLRDVSDVAVDSRDRVYAFQRSDPPVVIFEASGAYAGSWAPASWPMRTASLLRLKIKSCSPIEMLIRCSGSMRTGTSN